MKVLLLNVKTDESQGVWRSFFQGWRSLRYEKRKSKLSRGALVAGREKEGELVTRSPEFEYLHRKRRCEMLIGRDDSSAAIYLWLLFLNVCLHSRSFRLRADQFKSDCSVDGEPQGNWRWNSNSRDVIASSPSFSRPATRAPWRACSQAKGWREHATQ